MKISIKDAADLVGGNIIGDKDVSFSNVAKIENAGPDDLTFLYMPAYKKYLSDTSAAIVLTSRQFVDENKKVSYIVTDRPDTALRKIILKYFSPEVNLTGKAESASISHSAKVAGNAVIGENVFIGDNSVIGENTKIFHNTVILENVSIGNDCLLYPNITVRENCVIGDRVIIHPNTVVGSDGFGYNQTADGSYAKVPQIGNVVIEDDVELGSNVSIDRAALGSTVIGKGSKIDNLVQIAHNVLVGRHTVISAQTGVSGSTKIGSNCIIAGQVGFAGHLEIGDNVIIGAQTGVSKSLKKPGKYFGYPAKEMSTALRLEAHIRNLPNYSETITQLKKQIAELQKKINNE